MGSNTYKVFDGTNWVDICDCNVHINTISGWTKLDPRNCPTKYWTGTEWCPVVCTIPCSTCPEGYTLNTTTTKCEKFTPVDYAGTLDVISMGCNLVGTYGQYGLMLYNKFTFVTGSNVYFWAQLSDAIIKNNVTGSATPSINILPYDTGTTRSKFKAPVWYYRLASRGISRWNYKSWNKRKAYAVGANVIVFNIALNKWEKYTCTSAVLANIVAPYNSNPKVTPSKWSGPVALNYVYQDTTNNDVDAGKAKMVFKVCITLTESKTYHFGFAGDNRCSVNVQINETGPFQQLIDQAESENHWRWYVVPIEFPAGTHIIELIGENYGNVASVGFEIYDFNKANVASVDPVEKFKQEFIYASGTTTIDPTSHTADAASKLDPYIIFTTFDMRDKEVPTPNEINPATNLPYVLSCADGTPVSYCDGAPVCKTEVDCGTEIKIDENTEINIWFDNSGSMDTTLTPLETMQSTILKSCLLPIYNNDSALYDQKVRVLKMYGYSESPPWNINERFIRCISTEKNFNRTPDAAVKLVINLTFADESDSYGYGSTAAFVSTTRTSGTVGSFDSDIVLAKASLANAAAAGYVIKGYAFRVSTGNNAFQGFRGLTQATFVDVGVYAPPYNLSVEASANLFKYNLDVTPGAGAAYYKDRIIEGLQQLGIVVPACP
jgi:hypothetical protein